MDIKINDISITLTDEQKIIIQDGLAKQEPEIVAPPKGTLVYVWDADKKPKEPYVKYSDEFTLLNWKHWEVVPMGISFSDEAITSKEITPEMEKCLALCWDDSFITSRVISVIDSKSKDVFNIKGERSSFSYDHYKLCTTPVGNLPQMYIDMIEACED